MSCRVRVCLNDAYLYEEPRPRRAEHGCMQLLREGVAPPIVLSWSVRFSTLGGDCLGVLVGRTGCLGPAVSGRGVRTPPRAGRCSSGVVDVGARRFTFRSCYSRDSSSLVSCFSPGETDKVESTSEDSQESLSRVVCILACLLMRF